MKKYIIFCLLNVFVANVANAACTENTRTYTSCKPGYYFSSGTCTKCPTYDGNACTTPDKNTSGISSCNITITGSDASGSFSQKCTCTN